MLHSVTSVVIDTDFGGDVDDAIALALALASPELDVKAITVVGQQSLHRSRIAESYLTLANRNDIPVYAGLSVPIVPFPTAGTSAIDSRSSWSEIGGRGGLDPPERLDAVEALIELFSQPGGLELVAIGPLTNVYEALKRKPEIARNIRLLTIMGGYIEPLDFAGQTFPFRGDYNLCSDAQASLAVLQNPHIRIRLITADVTLKTWLSQADLDTLKESPHPFLQALARDIDVWTPRQERIFEYDRDVVDNVAFLHDPLTIAALYDESFCTFAMLNIENLITQSHVFRTIPRLHSIEGITKPMWCATDVDVQRFRAHVVQRLCAFFD